MFFLLYSVVQLLLLLFIATKRIKITLQKEKKTDELCHWLVSFCVSVFNVQEVSVWMTENPVDRIIIIHSHIFILFLWNKLCHRTKPNTEHRIITTVFTIGIHTYTTGILKRIKNYDVLCPMSDWYFATQYWLFSKLNNFFIIYCIN